VVGSEPARALPQALALTLGSDLTGVVETGGSNVAASIAPDDAAFGVTNRNQPAALLSSRRLP
jgi:hypothetical protein